MKLFKYISLILIIRSAQSICDFCQENFRRYASFGPHTSKNGFYVQQGITCNQIYMSATQDQNLCIEIKQKYKICCSETFQTPTQAPQPPPPLPPPLPPRNKICKLCTNGQEPRKKNTVIYSNFVSGSCIKLHNMGLAGDIPDSVCYPLQLYSKIPCGCDDVNTTFTCGCNDTKSISSIEL